MREDAAGNITQDLSSTPSHTYQWDAEGRLKSVDSGSSATYTYNALGQRVEDVIPGFRIEYVYDALGREMGSYDANGSAWWNRYFPFGGQPIGKYLGTSTYFFHTNHLGSTAMVTDHTGTVTQKEIYYPFGQLWATAGSGVVRRFASLQDPLPNSGPEVYAAPFRQYQSRLYRWLSPDPLAGDISNPQSLNRYAYVLNNPTNFIDPLGLDCSMGSDGVMRCVSWAPAPPDAFPLWTKAAAYTCMFDPNGFLCQALTGHGTTGGGGGGGGGKPKKQNDDEPCGNGFGGGAGVQFSGDLHIGLGESIGMTFTYDIGGGLFYDSETGFSLGGYETIGGATYSDSDVNSRVPAQQDIANPYAAVAFVGGGFGGFVTNAHSVQQLQGHGQTEAVNFGKGIPMVGVQRTTSGSISQYTVNPPLLGAGALFSLNRLTTNTTTTATGCK